MSDWLDVELSRELRPVKAPDELWPRVQAGRWAHGTRNQWRMPRTGVLVTALASLVFGMLWMGKHPVGLENLALRELDNGAQLELRSDNAVEVSAWLRREAGVNVTIPVSDRVQLTGARVTYARGMAIGEVAYRVADGTALLLVTQAGRAFSAPTRHGGLSWQGEQQVYAIASSMPDPQAACVLCHVSL